MRASETRERGYVTAETAVVVPSLIALLGLLLWGGAAVVAQVRCVDAASAGARAAARDEPPERIRRAVRVVAPRGAEVELSREGELVRVRVTARAAGPGPLGVDLEAEAVAHAEPG
ncbi:TadE family type IV pilus minor pilin [Streptomyces sp. DH37]|uniref:TadE family type IV pilus minor pilin n=1 Tax=Streptomyces sp. DH37 TaxID=3040122 RepID=UPI0024423E27|nr:TadE family type IV pilus minor pilin [Streptomyces sp. DH37]MDG9702750.1 TadE family type IV pilus minor pilin [Streptomyces sp. DH37]